MSDPPTLERFVDAVRGSNPFRNHRITDPDADQSTVASVHELAFNKLAHVVRDASRAKGSVGILLLGAAGVGKSHLLARLFQWAREDAATVVYLHNILASPERMARYVLSATLNDLVGHRANGYAQSRLYAIVNLALKKSGAVKDFMVTPEEIVGRQQALTELGRQVDPHGSVIPALNTFLTGTSQASLGDASAEDRARAAVLWLSGETLGPDEARLLGRTAGADGLALPDDAAVEQVFQVLARLCALAERPLVLCLDQIDNLDADAARALTSYAHALIDRSQHLVVIVSGVKQSLLALRTGQVIPAATWDRIAERTLELHLISPMEARAILEQRLDAALSGFEKEVEEVVAARRRDRLFPLGTAWLEQQLGSVQELRPRDVILWARDRWEAQRERLEQVGGARWIDAWPGAASDVTPEAPELDEVIDAEVSKKLVEGVNRRHLQQASLPPDEDNLSSLTHHLLERCKGQACYTLTHIERPAAKKRGPPATYQLLATERRLDGVSVTTGVTFVCAPSGHGAYRALQRMADDPQPPDHRILVTDEDRRPLRLGGVGKAAYDKLCAQGPNRFLHLRLGFSGHAELDSRVALLGAARSQDLEIEHPRGQYRKLTEGEVLASFHRRGLLLSHPLLRELLTEEILVADVGSSAPPEWDPHRTREYIMAELSWRLGLMTKELARIFVRRNKLPEARLADAWGHVKKIALALHDDAQIHATAQDDDFFIQLRSKK